MKHEKTQKAILDIFMQLTQQPYLISRADLDDLRIPLDAFKKELLTLIKNQPSISNEAIKIANALGAMNADLRDWDFKNKLATFNFLLTELNQHQLELKTRKAFYNNVASNMMGLLWFGLLAGGPWLLVLFGSATPIGALVVVSVILAAVAISAALIYTIESNNPHNMSNLMGQGHAINKMINENEPKHFTHQRGIGLFSEKPSQKKQPEQMPKPPATIPRDFECPICSEIMEDPVILSLDKTTYERQAITTWLSRNKRAPSNPEIEMLPNQTIDSVLSPNVKLKNEITTFRREHPELFVKGTQPNFSGLNHV